MTTVEIPPDVADRIEQRLDESGFDSLDDYVSFVLITLLDEIEDEPEDRKLEERLRSLGYR